MSAIDAIINYFKKKDTPEAIQVPEGYCPNCWGEQEYEGKVLNLIKDKGLDVKNLGDKRNFIQDFVVSHIDGIQLKNQENKIVCLACNAKK